MDMDERTEKEKEKEIEEEEALVPETEEEQNPAEPEAPEAETAGPEHGKEKSEKRRGGPLLDRPVAACGRAGAPGADPARPAGRGEAALRAGRDGRVLADRRDQPGQTDRNGIPPGSCIPVLHGRDHGL